MINFKIMRVDEPTHTVQIKYFKENKPDYFVRAFVEGDLTEANILAAADADVNVLQPVNYWNNLPANPLELSTTEGTTKERIINNVKPEYNEATQTLVKEINESDTEKVESWVVKDLSTEELSSFIRQKRNALLAQTDLEVLPDRNVSQEVLDYRQTLRDLPAQEGFPTNITWPVRPID